MDIKEAVEYLKLCKLEDICCHRGEYDNIIDLLHQGEKYKAMWQTLLEDLDFMPNKEKLFMDWKDFNDLMIKIKKKYLKED